MKRFILHSVLVSCPWFWIVATQALAGTFTIGGAVYTDLVEPLTSGMEDVQVCVECDGGFFGCDVTGGLWGGWDVSGVPTGSCTVTVRSAGLCFSHVVGGEIGEPTPITILVDASHIGENLSIQFLGTTGTSYCCVAAEDCDDGEACTLDECSDSVCANTLNDCQVDFNCDGSVGALDLALLLGSWGSCSDCESDLDEDGEVGASDLAILLGSWGPCP